MKRDAVDLALVLPHHEGVHARLTEWARWCRPGGGGSAVQPMFEGYRNGYEEPEVRGVPIDTLRAVAVQKAFTQLPEKHRLVLSWWYCQPYIPVLRVRQAAGLTTPALYELVHTSRTMMRNRLQCE